MNPVIRKLHEAQLRKDLPEFRAGDTVKVNVRLLEGEGEKVKERIQTFEGVVISKKGRASSASFTVRRVSFGTGVERIFPLLLPREPRRKAPHNANSQRDGLIARPFFLAPSSPQTSA